MGLEAIDTRNVTNNNSGMIRNFQHKGLMRLYHGDSVPGGAAEQVKMRRVILADLDAAARPDDMDLPAYELRSLEGRMKGLWAVKVTGDWCVTFRFIGSDVSDVDYMKLS